MTVQSPAFPLLLNLIPALCLFAFDKHLGEGGQFEDAHVVFLLRSPPKRTLRGCGVGRDHRELVTPSFSGVAFEKPSPFPSLGLRLCCGDEMGHVTAVAQWNPQHNGGGGGGGGCGFIATKWKAGGRLEEKRKDGEEGVSPAPATGDFS